METIFTFLKRNKFFSCRLLFECSGQGQFLLSKVSTWIWTYDILPHTLDFLFFLTQVRLWGFEPMICYLKHTPYRHSTQCLATKYNIWYIHKSYNQYFGLQTILLNEKTFTIIFWSRPAVHLWYMASLGLSLFE